MSTTTLCSNPALPPIYIGDDYSFSMTFDDVDGNLIDITGYTIVASMKSNKSDVATVWQSAITTHSDPTNGETTINILSADSGELIAGNYVFGAYWVDTNNMLKTILDTTIQVTTPTVVPTIPD